jgi:hypothetical protein
LDQAAPPGCGDIAAEFGNRAHRFLGDAAEELGRLSLGGKEGSVSVHDGGDHFVWESRDRDGHLIDSGRVDDLGRIH